MSNLNENYFKEFQLQGVEINTLIPNASSPLLIIEDAIVKENNQKGKILVSVTADKIDSFLLSSAVKKSKKFNYFRIRITGDNGGSFSSGIFTANIIRQKDDYSEITDWLEISVGDIVSI